MWKWRLKLTVITPGRQMLILIFFSQVQTTLTVVEEERDRFMSKLLNEEKTRKSLEGMLATFLLKTNSIVFGKIAQTWSLRRWLSSCVFLNTPLYFATEQHQELEHAIATLKSEKSHAENQFKILQQKNEIMVEMYQQKENALQQ